MLWSELASRVNERFGVPVPAKLFRFLHLLKEGASMPMAITSTANTIKSHKDPCLAGAVGAVVATAAGVLTGSEDVPAVAAGVVVAATGVLTGSEDVLAVTSGVAVAAARFADILRGRALGVLAVSEGMLTVSEGVLTVSAGGVAAAAGVTTVSAGVVTVAAGAAAAAAGVIVVSATVLVVAAGAAAAAAGVLAVSEGVLTVAVGAAAAAAQCSEIMFSSVTAKLLSAAAELTPLALCPMRLTSWPRCGLKSTLLVVILKMWPVLSSTTV